MDEVGYMVDGLSDATSLIRRARLAESQIMLTIARSKSFLAWWMRSGLQKLTFVVRVKGYGKLYIVERGTRYVLIRRV
jgi:hypothetical protein